MKLGVLFSLDFTTQLQSVLRNVFALPRHYYQRGSTDIEVKKEKHVKLNITVIYVQLQLSSLVNLPKVTISHNSIPYAHLKYKAKGTYRYQVYSQHL